MFINKTKDEKLNLCGKNIALLRKRLVPKTSQAGLARELSKNGLHLNKNAIQKIESGQRFVTDIEIKAIADFFGVCIDTLLLTDSQDKFWGGRKV